MLSPLSAVDRDLTKDLRLQPACYAVLMAGRYVVVHAEMVGSVTLLVAVRVAIPVAAYAAAGSKLLGYRASSARRRFREPALL